MARSPNFSCSGGQNCHGSRIPEYAPCNPAPSIGPWKRAGRSSRRSTSRRRQPRPAECENPINHPRVRDTYDSEVLEWSGLLDVLEGGGEVLELEVNGLLGGLGVLDGLGLEGVNGLQLSADIVADGSEGLESLLDLVDDGLVLEDGSVLGEVDGGGLLAELLDLAADVLVALLEGLEGGDGLATETEGAGDLGPVKLESCASLLGEGEN